jgi:hypothetical protein
MQRLKILLTLIIAISTLSLAACSTAKPCTPVTIPADGTDKNCPAGGSYCGSCEGQFCRDGFLWDNDYCTTVYRTGGTCACRCQ